MIRVDAIARRQRSLADNFEEEEEEEERKERESRFLRW